MSYQAYVTPALATAGVVGGVYCAYSWYKLQKNKLPEEWKEVGTLSDIVVYPIKSCSGIWLPTAECSNLGLRRGWLRDRVLTVVDDQNNFITARKYPQLLHVYPNVMSSILNLKHKDKETINVNLAEVIATEKPFEAQVWGVKVPVYDCGKEASEWFTSIINLPDEKFRLVYYAAYEARGMRPMAKPEPFSAKDTGIFPDEVSYNMINDASVDDLNSRLTDCVVSYRNFRPNFVLKGAKPYEEDDWKYVKIGENIFEIVKPCLRCIFTTIDPETGMRHKSEQPLKLLKSYRQIETSKSSNEPPRMGLQMVLRTGSGGMVSQNDKVYVA